MVLTFNIARNESDVDWLQALRALNEGNQEEFDRMESTRLHPFSEDHPPDPEVDPTLLQSTHNEFNDNWLRAVRLGHEIRDDTKKAAAAGEELNRMEHSQLREVKE